MIATEEHVERDDARDDPRDEARRALRLAAMATLVVGVVGMMALPTIAKFKLRYRSLFYQTFASMEPPAMLLLGLFAVTTLLLLAKSGTEAVEPSVEDDDWFARLTRRSNLVLGVLLAWTGAIVLIGFHLAFDSYFLADDEYSAYFQAKIFAHGQWSATVPPALCKWIDPITPTTIGIDRLHCSWHLAFLPIHSMVRGAFIAAHLDWLAGPLAAMVSAWLVYSIARRMWPDRMDRALLATAFMATSTQLLFMSMTMFSMYLHLLCALVWLRLYVENRTWSIALLPVVAFIAFGVHSPIPHGLWVAPFLLRFVWQRRWGAVAYLAVTYFVVMGFWAYQLGFGKTAATAAGNATTTGVAVAAAGGTVAAVTAPFSKMDRLQAMTTGMHVTLFLTWETPMAILCVWLAVVAWKKLDTTSRDLVFSIVVIIVARAFDATPQGEGWGYRFAHDALGNVALVAAVGVGSLIEALGRRRALGLVAASLAATVLIQVPMRTVQVEHVVGPYARMYRFLAGQRADAVVFPASSVLWGRQMLRNDPDLHNRPILMNGQQLNIQDLDSLKKQFDKRVRIVLLPELLPFGVEKAPVMIGGTILQ